jgi:hypothetical protein
MNAQDAASTAVGVVQSLTDVHLPEHAEDALRSDDGLVHLANALRQLEHAERSGVALDASQTANRELVRLVRQRSVDVLRDHADDAPDLERHEDLIAKLEGER